MNWFRGAGRWISGAEAREREEERRSENARRHNVAAKILAEHEARNHFGGQEALDRLSAEMPEAEATQFFADHCRTKLEPVVNAVLEDGLLSPDEDERISAVTARYGGIQLGSETQKTLEAARQLYQSLVDPLAPVETPLLLKKGEWCAHAIKSQALEERQRTTRVNYSGPAMSVRIMKGVYYRAGSIQAQRVQESYHHSFGDGVLGATNQRLLWVSPQKSISIPLSKVVMFEPFLDGMKIIKDTGKPLLFIFENGVRADAVRIGRVIEELR